MKTILSALTLILLVSGCGPKIQYIGRTYAPTGDIGIFFSPYDIKKEYEIMGKVEGMDLRRYQKIQIKIIAEAKKRGADAILISGMGNEITGYQRNSTTTATGVLNNQPYNSTVATVTTTTDQGFKILHADFIKYK